MAPDDANDSPHASISAVRGRREVETLASANGLTTGTDQAQYDAGERPCLDVRYDRGTVRLDDMATEPR